MLGLPEGDCFLGSQIVSHDFHEQLTTTAHFRRQALADDVTQDIRQTHAQLLLFAEREHAENTIDRLAGVDRVERAQNKVTCLRCH